jgi:hypothetical protein
METAADVSVLKGVLLIALGQTLTPSAGLPRAQASNKPSPTMPKEDLSRLPTSPAIPTPGLSRLSRADDKKSDVLEQSPLI